MHISKFSKCIYNLDIKTFAQKDKMVDTNEKISELRSRTGIDFDKTFLEIMIELYEANIEMLELADTYSSNSDVTDLSQSMASDLEEHLREMRELLGVS